MRIAALDVGSNSFHLIVADVGTGGHINVLDRSKEMVRLGDSTLHHGVIPRCAGSPIATTSTR
jgi:exopolyphosphatase/pppGpp-phosphohydrolase